MRQRIALRDDSRRQPDQRFLMRFPGLLALLGRAVSRLPPQSRIRRAIIGRGTRLSFEAVNREDFAAAFSAFRPDAETRYPPEFAHLGMDATTRGRENRIDFQRRWFADWGEVRNELEELVDLGDRLLILGRYVGSGITSGASFDREVAYLFTLHSGLVAGEQIFLSHSEALRAAGLAH